MINFPWHVDFGAGVATTLAICAITALSHDQGHTGFPWSLSVLFEQRLSFENKAIDLR